MKVECTLCWLLIESGECIFLRVSDDYMWQSRCSYGRYGMSRQQTSTQNDDTSPTRASTQSQRPLVRLGTAPSFLCAYNISRDRARLHDSSSLRMAHSRRALKSTYQSRPIPPPETTHNTQATRKRANHESTGRRTRGTRTSDATHFAALSTAIRTRGAAAAWSAHRPISWMNGLHRREVSEGCQRGAGR